jgi:hypothetical protein
MNVPKVLNSVQLSFLRPIVCIPLLCPSVVVLTHLPVCFHCPTANAITTLPYCNTLALLAALQHRHLLYCY